MRTCAAGRGIGCAARRTSAAPTTQVKWVSTAAISDLQMDRSQRMRIDWASSQIGTWIDPVGD